MVGALTRTNSCIVELGEEFSLDRRVGDYRPIFFKENKGGVIVVESTRSLKSHRAFSLSGAHALVHLSSCDKSALKLEKGSIVSVVLIDESMYLQRALMMDQMVIQNMRTNMQHMFVSVGIVTIDEISNQVMGKLTPKICSMF